MRNEQADALPQLQMEALEDTYGAIRAGGGWLSNRWLIRVGRTILVVIAGVILWQLLVWARIFSPIFLPPPLDVVRSAQDIVRNGYFDTTLIQNLVASVERVGLGFLAAVVLGITLGVAMARSDWIFDLIDPFIEFIRPVPPLAYIPLLVVWFGIGELPKVILIMTGTLPMIVLSTVAGVRGTPQQRVNVARCFGASSWQIFRHVYMPSALPEIFTGLRVGIGIAWSSLVAAEIIAAQAGLGWMIEIAGRELQVSIIFIGIVLIGIFGYGMDLCIRVVEHYVVPWRRHAGM
jgi:NitT/TauT family transport system permease protein/taurine transport system permease protein